jgi:DNA-binding MarR family transcriptional regulator
MTTSIPLGPTAQKVLDYLKQDRGTAFAAGDICEVADCSTGQAQIALETLADAGLIERQTSALGATTYVVRK